MAGDQLLFHQRILLLVSSKARFVVNLFHNSLAI
jgi:hypothetical protein